MSLSLKGVAERHAPTTAPLPKKEESKKGLTEFVLSNLTKQAMQTLSLDATLESSPAKKKEAVENIMHLKRVQFEPGRFNVPPLNLQLTRQETHTLEQVFESWSLNQQISLLDLWAVDLFALLEKFLQYFPSEREKLLSEFCTNFILGSVSMMMEDGEKADPLIPKLEFYERGKSADVQYFVMTRSEWAFCLEDLKSSLNSAMSTPKGRLKSIQSLFKEVQNRLNLGCKFLRHPQALIFLRDFNLLTLEPYFPKAQALNQGGVEKALADLTTYVRFLEQGFASGCALGKLSVRIPFLEKFQKLLTDLHGNNQLAPAAQKVKNHLSAAFSIVANMNNELAGNYLLARQGKLTHEAFCRVNGIQIKAKKSQQEFAAALYFKFGQVDLFNAFVHDCLDIFDERIMEPLFPDTFVTTSVAFNRLAANLSFFLQKSSGLSSPAQLASPAVSLSQAGQLKALLTTIHQDLNIWSKATDPQALLDAALEWRELNEKARIFYNHWIPYIAKFQPAVNAVDALVPSLDSLRKKTLQNIGEFLKSHDPEEVRQNRIAWTSYFREVCFQEGLAFCRITMLANDMRAVLAFKTDLSAMNSEEHLLPPALVDFLDLEGIEEVINQFLPPQRPMAEDLEDKPVRVRVQAAFVATLEKRENKEQQPASRRSVQPTSHPRQVEPEIFRIRRGEKTRKILARLREMGFLPTKVRRGGTSHLKLENKEGKKTIVPLHRDQKPGTARSIEKQTGKI